MKIEPGLSRVWHGPFPVWGGVHGLAYFSIGNDSMTLTQQQRTCGAVFLPDESVRWKVWAPRAERVDLVLVNDERRELLPVQKDGDGFFTLERRGVSEGQQYAYRLDGGDDRPDPCSLWQPRGVFGPSAVVRPERFAWSDAAWKGVARADLVFYELHVGAFTSEGTFDAVIPRLASLKELGITAIEIMPVGQFPGGSNWGYDGVLPFAAQDTYGGPHGLQKLVDACHAAGLAVFLDVVYNHVGPEGNFLNEYGPYFTDNYRTPWGKAVNFDGAHSGPVRQFVLDNVRMWLEEFHFDGLRLDAVHAIYDLGARHILQEIQEVADQVSAEGGRAVHIVAESDLNDPRVLRPPAEGGYGLGGQWSDDFHHTVHTLLTDERRGYYQDFGEAQDLARVLEQPFLYAGHFSRHRGRTHGAPAEGLTGDRFVVCLQNHDQVGNRARGDRLNVLLGSPAKQRLAASLLLLSPHLPLLFMGEEYGEENPFPFFCSFCDAALIQAVREGRKREFADFLVEGDVPDPHESSTFAAARLSWDWPEGSARAGTRRLYADLLAARREWPAMRDFTRRAARLLAGPEAPAMLELIRGAAIPEPATTVRVYFNLADIPQALPANLTADGHVLFRSEAPRYKVAQDASCHELILQPWECVVFGPATYRRFV